MPTCHQLPLALAGTTLAGLVPLLPVTATASSGHGWPDSLETTLGLTVIDPRLSSDDIVVTDPDTGDSFTLEDSTITDRGSVARPSLALRWQLPSGNGNWALETVLAPPYRFSFEASGGDLENNVDGKLGETDMLPPVLILLYAFPVSGPVQPYMGLGGTWLYSFNSRITANELGTADLEIDNVGTWLAQAGININLDLVGLNERLFFNLDMKYVDPVRADARITNMELDDGGGGTITVERSDVRFKLEPIAIGAGIGWRF